ncbi:predicted protein [Botrytis cinerea T4]|uniref:Uncharacterized protein n=1 Tax=Botryotinia fuckeliana (strain T4) TaxID=999810 RepID=G2YT32_BOTF4|nr:predicted protein [Botrytis cinerea T4]
MKSYLRSIPGVTPSIQSQIRTFLNINDINRQRRKSGTQQQ